MRCITGGRRLASVGLGLVLVLLLAGCGNKVLMVGDSVTVGAGPAVDQKLTGIGWDATVDGKVGRTTSEMLSVVRSRRADNNVFIIEAGYNDAADTGAFRSRLAAILDDLRDADVVVVVTLYESRGYYATANATIRDLASSHPNVVIADWAAKARATGGLVSSDGVHLTTAGYSAMAQLLADVLGPVPDLTSAG